MITWISRAALVALSLASVTPAAAEPWQQSGDRLAVPAAGISFPTRAGAVALAETGEASLRGEGVDDLAQYRSGDGAVVATLFVFLPAYADAALTAWELDKVVHGRFGEAARLESSRAVPLAGTPSGALRRVWLTPNAGMAVSTGAFAKIGRWIVVIRVSGPAARRAEVETALDALIGGVAVTGTAKVDPVAEPQVSECPAAPGKAAKHTELRLQGLGLSNDPITRMLIDSTLASGLAKEGKEKEPPFPTSIADNGRKPVCIRDHVTIGDNRIDLMQPAGDTARPEAVIGIVNDAGKTVEMRKGEMGENYMVRIHNVGRTANYGAYDRLLTGAQIDALLRGDPKAGRMSSEVTYKADGTFATNVYVTMGR